MTDGKYNGWTNYETWLTYLHYGDALYDDAHEARAEGFTYDADACREWVQELVDEGASYGSCSLVGDVMGQFMHAVNWEEIAEHANED